MEKADTAALLVERKQKGEASQCADIKLKNECNTVLCRQTTLCSTPKRQPLCGKH